MTRQITRRGLFRGLMSGQDEARLNNPNIKNITINSNVCIEFKGMSCRRCGEVCDQSAIAFKLAGRGLYKPVIDINQCIFARAAKLRSPSKKSVKDTKILKICL